MMFGASGLQYTILVLKLLTWRVDEGVGKWVTLSFLCLLVSFFLLFFFIGAWLCLPSFFFSHTQISYRSPNIYTYCCPHFSTSSSDPLSSPCQLCTPLQTYRPPSFAFSHCKQTTRYFSGNTTPPDTFLTMKKWKLRCLTLWGPFAVTPSSSGIIITA